MVVDSEIRRRDISEAILAKLRFAVAPVDSAEKAVKVIETLEPEVIVASEQDAYRIRELSGGAARVPILALGEETMVTDALVEAVRRMLHERLSEA
jgi:hypothetical protein